MLTIINGLPEGLLDLESRQLANVLKGPTLLHLEGRRDETLFVSVLLHGNEPTGWEAIRRLLKEYDAGGGDKPLPRNLSLFIGNVQAAQSGLRRLDGQPDYNRVWPGGEQTDTPEGAMIQLVVDTMTQRNLFASIDIHNNTGINPHYGCINVVDNRFLRLALLFSRLVIYFIRPAGVQSLAMARHCPAVTIEAGKVGAVGQKAARHHHIHEVRLRMVGHWLVPVVISLHSIVSHQMKGKRMLQAGVVRALGTMSGTSLDGIDAAVIDTDGVRIFGFGPSNYRPYTPAERTTLRAALGKWPTDDVAAAARLVEDTHVAVMRQFDDVALAGFHGQTLAHDPGGRGTHQCGDGARIAQALGLPVAWDFRSADVAAGGQAFELMRRSLTTAMKHLKGKS